MSSFFEIMFVLFLGSLLSLGGGNGPSAFIQDHWVRSGVLDASLFTWALALGNLSPGPKAGFVAGVGYYLLGFPGAVAATLGVLIPSWLGAAGVVHGMNRMKTVISRVGLPASFVIAGLIAAAAWGTALPLDFGAVEMLLVVIVAFLVAARRIEAGWLMLTAAGAGLLWAFLTT